MVVGNSASFGAGTSEILMTDDGNGNLTAQVDFTSGQYFTFVQPVTAPGGVTTKLKAWYKANDGTLTGNGSSVNTWTNSATGSTYNVTQATALYQPKFYNTTANKLVNNNPSIEFDGIDDQLNNSTRLFTATDSFEMLAVGVQQKTKGTASEILGMGNDGNCPAFGMNAYTTSGWYPYVSTGSPAGYTASNAILYNGFAGGNNQQAQIYGMSMPNGGTDNVFSNIDGYIEPTTLDANGHTYIGNMVWVGNTGSAEFLKGLVNEIIIYNKKLTAIEQSKVNSYLAIKYGITLDQRLANDYITSDETSIYAASTFGDYDHDIAGIGMDICSGLLQPKSTSVNEDAVVTMQANVANISNKEFLVWANNDLALAPDEKTKFPTSGLPSYECPSRLSRIWHVQKTGDVGNVTLSFNVKNISIEKANNIRLLIRNGNDDMSGATVSSIIPTIIGDTVVQFANVSFANRDYFTIIGNTLKVPGMVNANLIAWYKADAGVTGSPVSTWADQTVPAYNLTQATAGSRPTTGALMNFNPTLTFDGAKYLSYKSGRFMSTTSPGTLFGAANNNIDNGGYENLADIGIDNPHMGIYNNTMMMYMTGSAPIQVNHSNNITQDINQVYGWSWNGGTNAGSQLRLDGTSNDFANTDFTLVGNGGVSDGMFSVGSYEGLEIWNGDIAEVILYNRNLTEYEKKRVETYLAIKYGTTLSHDYLSGKGDTIWKIGGGYDNDIAGIGREDCQLLLQKQSKSTNTTSVVTIYNGNQMAGLPTTNAANSSTFAANESFMVWGNNGGSVTYGVSYTPHSFTPSGSCFYHMNRIWKVQEKGSVGTVTVKAPAKAQYLLVHNSANFSTGMPTEIPLVNDGSGNLLATVDFTNGQYFTFGTLNSSPGGVAANLVAWYKANDSILTGNGSLVSTWTNSVIGSTYNVSQATTLYQPTFYNTTANKLLNYNPSLEFSFHELANSARLYANTSGFELLGVAKDTRTTTSTLNGFMGVGYDGNYPALDINTAWRPWMYVSSPSDQWTGGSSILYNGSNGGANQQPQIFGIGTTNLFTAYDANANNMISNVDGYKEGTYLDAYRQSEIGNGLFVGSSGGQEWTGLIPEIIVYNRKLDSLELLRVNSYLAIKYGITLDQRQTNDYIASDGTSIYAASSYGTYNNDIAAIGQDICSGLFQPKSTSVNEDAVVTISATPANIQNKEFLAWANNGFPLNVINSTDVPALSSDCSGRLSRIWHVQKTAGDVGTVTLDFDLRKLPYQAALNNFKLLIRNGSFAMNGATISPITPTIIGDTIVRFSNVTFNNNDYFTLYGNSISPGGVSNHLVAWYKADNNTSSVATSGTTVTKWNDNYGNRDLVRYYNTSEPTYRTAATKLLNYNNSIEFDNDAAVEQLLYNTSTFFPNYSGFQMITVGKDLETNLATLRATAGMGNFAAGNYPGLDIQSDVTNGWNFVMDLSSSCYYYAQCGTQTGYPLLYNGHTGGANQQPQIYSVGSANASPSAANNMYTYIDGYKWLTDMDAFQQAPIGKHLYVGSSWDAPWDGLVGEVLIYDGLLSDAEVLRINTYLAIKYGITLNQSNIPANDYTASDGTVIYAASTYDAFDHDIAGIGLDSCSGLLQPKSTSVNADAVVTMEATASFDKSISFLVWANNDEDTDGDGNKLEDVLYTGMVCADSILDRDWKVQLTNFNNKLKPVNVTFDRSKLTTIGKDFALLIDTTGNTNYNHAYIIQPTSVTSTTITFNGVTQFTNGAVFTLATDVNAHIAKLYPYGNEVSTQKCRNGQWIYLKDPTSENHYLGAIKDSNFIIDLNNITPKIDINSAYADLGEGSAIQAVRLMRRMLEINCNSCYDKIANPTPNFTVRMLYSPEELQAARDGSGGLGETEYLNVLTPLAGTPILEHWFKVDGLVSSILPVPAHGIEADGQIWALGSLTTGLVNSINYVDFLPIDSFSVFGYAISKAQIDNSPLPIELLSFNGINVGDDNLLYWTTTAEVNNEKFIIEHSTDGANFTSIGEVLGAGNSNVSLDYQFSHLAVPLGNNYYRLKQVDFDGDYSYSNMIVIKNNGSEKQEILIYPNPVNSELNIAFSNIQNTSPNVRIINTLGQEVYTKQFDISQNRLVKIDTRILSNGMYILFVEDMQKGTKQYYKFNKQ
jgi:hypothetical protein